MTRVRATHIDLWTYVDSVAFWGRRGVSVADVRYSFEDGIRPSDPRLVVERVVPAV